MAEPAAAVPSRRGTSYRCPGDRLRETVRQFNKLPADKQYEVHKAYVALMSPTNLVPIADPAPADT